MIQTVKLTWEERYNMYISHTKEELASMLAEQAKYTNPEGCKEYEIEYFSLKARYQDICDTYLQEFITKHDFPCEYNGNDVWVGNNPGTIAMLGDFFVAFDDIRYDIDNNIPEEKYIQWYSRYEELSLLELKFMNYQSFCKGAPDPYTEEQVESIIEAKNRVHVAKENLEKLLSEIKSDKSECF
jgi:hypothetical protein